MSTNLFTPEQEAYLRGHDIDTSLPIFPLSCHIAAKTLYYGSRCFKFEQARESKENGTYKESLEEFRKSYADTLLQYEYKPSRGAYLIFAFIIGGILELILTLTLWIAGQVLIGPIGEYRFGSFASGFCFIMQFVLVFLCYKVIEMIFKKAFLKNRRQEINEETAIYKRNKEEYQNNLKDADAHYEEYKRYLEELIVLRGIIAENREALPQNYWGASNDFIKIYNNRRADNVADAIRVYEEMRHQQQMEIQQEKQTQLANQANIAAQQALQAARNAEANSGVYYL